MFCIENKRRWKGKKKSVKRVKNQCFLQKSCENFHVWKTQIFILAYTLTFSFIILLFYTICHGFLFLSISNPITEEMLWFIKEHASELSLRFGVVPEYKIVCNAESRADETLEFNTWRGYHALFGKSAPVLATNSDNN